MKKTLFLIAISIILIGGMAHAGPVILKGGGGTPLPSATVAALPAGPSTNTVYVVTDGSTAGDCLVGGGSDKVICVYNGAAWVAAGDGTGGAGSGSMTTVEMEDVQVGGADIVSLDFDGDVFAITESPDTEINIALDLTPSSGDATLAIANDSLGVATGSLTNTHFKVSTDWGDVETDGSGNVLLDDDVVAAAEMADADHGMVSWSSGVATVEDFALNADADAGDYDIQSIDRLEGVDAQVYIDLGGDGYIDIEADTMVRITAPTDFGDEDITSLDKLEGVTSATYIDLGAEGYMDLEAGTQIRITAPVDVGDEDITSVDKLEGYDAAVFIDLGADGITEIQADTKIQLDSPDVIQYEASNDGNPEYRIGAADAEEARIQAVYDTGAQTLDYLLIQTETASATADKGRIVFNVDEVTVAQFDDAGLEIGVTSVRDGVLTLHSDQGHYVSLQPHATTTANTPYIFPAGAGTTGQYLQLNDQNTGQLAWADPSGSGGDITAVGNFTTGAAFTEADTQAGILYFEGSTANDYEIALASANPGADYTITLPATTGYVVLGPSDFVTNDALIKTDLDEANEVTLTQVTGIIVDDSNNVSGLASLAIGTDPADAGAIRLANAGYIYSEADATGTDISVIGVDSSEIVQIGASGASGVTITPATTISGALTLSSTLTDGTATLNTGAWTGITTISMGDALTLSDGATLDQSADNYVGFTENSDSFQVYFGGSDVDLVWSDGALNLRNNEDLVDAIVEIEGKDAGEKGVLRVLSDGDDKYITLYHDDTDSWVASSSGNIILAPDGDTDDYIFIDTTTNVASISAVGGDGTLGTASAEWGGLYLGDGKVIYFGNDQDVTLTHVADTGLNLNTSFSIADDKSLTFGGNLSGYDWLVSYDETTDDRLEFVHTAGAGADVYFDLNDNAAASTFTIANSDGTYAANLVVDGTISEGGTSLVSKYQGINAYLTDISAMTATIGDIMYFDGTDWVILDAGTNGYYLQAQGASAPAWAEGSGTGVNETFGVGWDGDTSAPEKDDVYDAFPTVANAPSLTFSDLSASEAGTADIKVDAATAGQDSSLRLYVDDSTGEDTLYVTVDGTNEEILFAKKIDLTSAGIENVGAIADDGAISVVSSGSTVTIESVVFTGGALSSVSTITNTGNITTGGDIIAADGNTDLLIQSDDEASDTIKLQVRDVDGGAWVDVLTATSGNTPTLGIASTGAMTVASSASTVTVESVVFTGGALSSVTSITDGTASWSSSSLSGFADITSTDDITVGDDLLFASGAVVNFDSGDITITHSANTLTVAGGNLDMGTGTVTAASYTATASATPSLTFSDSDTNAAGTGDIKVDATTATYDSSLRIYVDDSTGEDTLYVTVDGVNEEILFAKKIDLTSGGIENVGNISDDAAFSITSSGGAVTLESVVFTGGDMTYVDSIAPNGAADFDIGGASTTDVTATTDGGSVVLDGSVTASASTPFLTLSDTDDAAGTGTLTFASANLQDIVASIQVDEGGTAVTYMVLDGVNDKVIVGQASPDDNNVSFAIQGDADSDAAGDTTEALTFTLTGNATPTSSTWAIADTQGAGITLLSTAGTVTVESVVFTGGALSSVSTINMSGDITVGGGNINTGDIALVVGDATTDTITLTTDGTGDAEIVLPNDSIGDAEIDWDGLTASHTLTLPGLTMTGAIAGATGLTLGSATVDAGGDFIMIMGAQTDDPQVVMAMSDDANGDFTITLSNGDDADFTIVAGDDIYLNPVGLGVVIGDNGNEDYILTFDADTNDLTLTWDEDNAEFEIASVGDEDIIFDLDGSNLVTISSSTGATFAFTPAVGFSGNITLDDGSGNSPTITLTDATDETAVFEKVDSGYITLTTVAADGLQIVTGNLKVGGGTPGQTINGEDGYVTGLLEVDAMIYADGGITGNLTGNASGTAATVTGAAQSAITSVGTLTSITTSGTITLQNGETITNAVNGTVLVTGALSSTGVFQTGTDGTDGQITIHSEQGVTDYSVIIQPHGTMTASTTYLLPPAVGTANQVLGIASVDATTATLAWQDDDSAGATAFDDVGDPDAVVVIEMSDGETVTFDGANDNEVFITFSLNAADLTGDTTGLLITAVDNDDANYIPLLIQDDQDGTPDTLFSVNYQGTLTLLNGETISNTADGVVVVSDNITIGDNTDGQDYVLTFDGNAGDLTLTWMEDEHELRIADSAGEDITIDLDTATDNEIGISTQSSATQINIGALNLVASGFITGGVKPIIITTAEGQHDGDNNAATLSDSGESFTTSAYVGMKLVNVTDGSSCTVTANDSTTMTCTLAGGTDNDWDTNDYWAVAPGPYQSGTIVYIGSATTIMHPATANYAVCYYSTGANAVKIDPLYTDAAASTMRLWLDGVDTGTDGDELDSASGAGDFICIHNVSSTLGRTLGRSGTWTDGGAN